MPMTVPISYTCDHDLTMAMHERVYEREFIERRTVRALYTAFLRTAVNNE